MGTDKEITKEVLEKEVANQLGSEFLVRIPKQKKH